ncbi:MAG: peptide-methionine (S)-S-oxide reductase MsrA [Actinomycetota bacterium]|nr:MAG: peptide-methionine (S)-S-oxide reductase MsrA [Actinomycetota bacterium]
MSFSSLFGARSRMVTEADALPGRPVRPFHVPAANQVLGKPMEEPWPDGVEILYVGLGCFWGAEKRFWRLPGVYSTAVGYQGGYTPNPTYDEVCTGRTGHAENVLVAYEPTKVSTYDVLKVFWENHDPTQGYRQGNDVGTQYRSAVYWTTTEQAQLAERTARAYDAILRGKGYGEVTTEIGPAADRPFYYAEEYHQQYLYKVPHGYDCHAETGISLPPLAQLPPL